MKIIGSSGTEYEVCWRKYGYGWAIPLVYLETKHSFLGIKFKTKKLVWDKNPRTPLKYTSMALLEVEAMLPSEMKQWFQASVDYYEVYQQSWKENI